MKCTECGADPMDLIQPTVTYHGVPLGRYKMWACPKCELQLLTEEGAVRMRKKVDAAIRARRIHGVPKILSQVAPEAP